MLGTWLPTSLLGALLLLLPLTESKHHAAAKHSHKLAARGTHFYYGPVPLGSACPYALLSEGIMFIGATNTINGSIGMNLTSANFQGTGLGVLTPSVDGTYSTTNATKAVNGKVFATDYKSPTPANLAQAMLDMENAYRFGMTEGPPTNVAPVGAYELGGQIITPGIYKFPAAVAITTTLTLNGNCTDVFVFQVGAALTTAASVVLTGGVTASSVFWMVNAAFGPGSATTFQGTVITAAALTYAATTNFVGHAYSLSTLTTDASFNLIEPPFCQNPYTGACLSQCSNVCPPGSPAGTNTAAVTPPAPVYSAYPSLNTTMRVNLTSACPFEALGISVAGDPGGTEINGDTGATGGMQIMTTSAGQNAPPISNYYLRPDPSGNNVFATSPYITGKVYAPNFGGNTSTVLSNAATDAMKAFNQAFNEPFTATAGASDISGRTFLPGVYQYTAAVAINTPTFLTGNCGDIFIFQINGALNFGSGGGIVLQGGVTASTVFFATVGATGVGANVRVQGIILTTAAIGFGAGSSLIGMAYALTSTGALSLGAGVTFSPPQSCSNPNNGCFSPCGTECPMPNPNAYPAAAVAPVSSTSSSMSSSTSSMSSSSSSMSSSISSTLSSSQSSSSTSAASTSVAAASPGSISTTTTTQSASTSTTTASALTSTTTLSDTVTTTATQSGVATTTTATLSGATGVTTTTLSAGISTTTATASSVATITATQGASTSTITASDTLTTTATQSATTTQLATSTATDTGTTTATASATITTTATSTDSRTLTTTNLVTTTTTATSVSTDFITNVVTSDSISTTTSTLSQTVTLSAETVTASGSAATTTIFSAVAAQQPAGTSTTTIVGSGSAVTFTFTTTRTQTNTFIEPGTTYVTTSTFSASGSVETLSGTTTTVLLPQSASTFTVTQSPTTIFATNTNTETFTVTTTNGGFSTAVPVNRAAQAASSTATVTQSDTVSQTTTVLGPTATTTIYSVVAAQQPGGSNAGQSTTTTVTGGGSLVTLTFSTVRTETNSFVEPGTTYLTSTTYAASSSVETISGMTTTVVFPATVSTYPVTQSPTTILQTRTNTDVFTVTTSNGGFTTAVAVANGGPGANGVPTTTTTTVFTASPNAAVRTAVAAQQPGAGGPSTTITGAGTPQTFTFTATRTGVNSFTQSGFVFETSTTYPPSSAVQTVNGTPTTIFYPASVSSYPVTQSPSVVLNTFTNTDTFTITTDTGGFTTAIAEGSGNASPSTVTVVSTTTVYIHDVQPTSGATGDSTPSDSTPKALALPNGSFGAGSSPNNQGNLINGSSNPPTPTALNMANTPGSISYPTSIPAASCSSVSQSAFSALSTALASICNTNDDGTSLYRLPPTMLTPMYMPSETLASGASAKLVGKASILVGVSLFAIFLV